MISDCWDISIWKELMHMHITLHGCPRFWPLAPPPSMNPGMCSFGMSEDPPRYLSFKFKCFMISDCRDIYIWITSTHMHTTLQRCPRFWPLTPTPGISSWVCSFGISENPPRYLFQIWMLCDKLQLRYRHLKNFNAVWLERERKFFFFFLIWVLRPFQEYFTYIEPIVHQRWAKKGEPG